MKKTAVWLLIVVVSWTVLAPLWVAAQEAAPAPASAAPAAAGPPPPAKGMTLWQYWKVGGWCMWPILACNIAAVAYAVYGYILCGDKRMTQMALVPTLQDQMQRLDFRAAGATCTGSPSVMTNILSAGLMRLTGGQLDVGAMEKAMEEAAVEENVSGMRTIGYLSISATIAPMFGLLGTVSGMLKAFQKLGQGQMGDPEKLANDIGEALITTFYGLPVGILAMFFYFYHKSTFQANMARIGRLVGNITHMLEGVVDRIKSGELSLEGLTVPEHAMHVTLPPAAGAPAPAVEKKA